MESAFLERWRAIVVSTIAYRLGITSPSARLVLHMVRFGAFSWTGHLLSSYAARCFTCVTLRSCNADADASL